MTFVYHDFSNFEGKIDRLNPLLFDNYFDKYFIEFNSDMLLSLPQEHSSIRTRLGRWWDTYYPNVSHVTLGERLKDLFLIEVNEVNEFLEFS